MACIGGSLFICLQNLSPSGSSHLSLSDFKAAPAKRERESELIRNTSEARWLVCRASARDNACKADMVMQVCNDAYNSI